MDLTTLIGIVCGIFLVINGIGMDKIGNFVDIPSILIAILYQSCWIYQNIF